MIIAMMGGTFDKLTQKKEAGGTIVVTEQVLRLEIIADQRPVFKNLGKLIGRRAASSMYSAFSCVDCYASCFEKLRSDLAKDDTDVFRCAKGATSVGDSEFYEELEHYEQPAGGGHPYAPGKRPREGVDSELLPSSMKIFGPQLVKRAMESLPERDNWSLQDDVRLSHVLAKHIKGKHKMSRKEQFTLWIMKKAGDGPFRVVLNNWLVLYLLDTPKQLLLLFHERGDSKVQTSKQNSTTDVQIQELSEKIELLSTTSKLKELKAKIRIARLEEKIDRLLGDDRRTRSYLGSPSPIATAHSVKLIPLPEPSVLPKLDCALPQG